METTNDATRATAEAMPTINRRRMLLGLAAASTAAATASVGASALQQENPKLLALSEQLPAAVQACNEAKRSYEAWKKAIEAATPWAPDELTAPGTGWPSKVSGQPGEPEMNALGGYLWRVGDDFPRRIVVSSWQVNGQLYDARRKLRKAKKAGCVIDCLHLDGKIKRLKRLRDTAVAYEAEFAKVKAKVQAEHEDHSAFKARTKLEKFIATIMGTPDWTMEGLVIKAQALAEWDRGCDREMEKVAFQHGCDWHGQIAASILRHAQVGAA